ncbi:hypothetical protein AX16_001359 [Volvariella volvacea WC 439]|nr:hypothetical protein AX16_001359 [Volvariella volvacea WC 439]
MEKRIQDFKAKHKQALTRAEEAETKNAELKKLVAARQKEVYHLENSNSYTKEFMKLARSLSDVNKRLREAQLRLAELTTRAENGEAKVKRLEAERDRLEDEYEKSRKEYKRKEEDVNSFLSNL